jgi:hypothetical protein
MIDIAPRGIWVTALAVALLTVAVPPSLDLGEEGSEYQLPADRGAQASPSTEWALGSFEPPNRMAIYSHVDDERSAVEALQIAENVGVKVPSIDYDASRGAYYVEDGVRSYEVVVYETPNSFLLRDETIFNTITDGKQPDLRPRLRARNSPSSTWRRAISCRRSKPSTLRPRTTTGIRRWRSIRRPMRKRC